MMFEGCIRKHMAVVEVKEYTYQACIPAAKQTMRLRQLLGKFLTPVRKCWIGNVVLFEGEGALVRLQVTDKLGNVRSNGEYQVPVEVPWQ